MPKTLTATPFAFIFVFNDDEKNPAFPLIVIEALGEINKGVNGQALLQAIAHSLIAASPDGFKVKIVRPELEKEEKRLARPENPGTEGGSRAVAFNEHDAQSGRGSLAACFWNPCVYNTPLGARPAFIGLAHELVHCLHYLRGTKKAGYDDEERYTVGLPPYNAEPITENTIRDDHHVPRRDATDPPPA